jgi:hypothetical protein
VILEKDSGGSAGTVRGVEEAVEEEEDPDSLKDSTFT